MTTGETDAEGSVNAAATVVIIVILFLLVALVLWMSGAFIAPSVPATPTP